MKRLVFISIWLILYHNIVAQCTPSAISATDVTKAIVSVTYNGEKFTGTLVNNSTEDGTYYLITSMLPFHAFCGSSPSSYISNISFKWHNGQSTSGATFLSSWSLDEFVAILELDDPPPYETISYLGISQGGSGTRCIANYNTTLVEYDVNSSVAGNISVSCSGGRNFDFTSGRDATVVNSWDNPNNLDDDSNPLGAPLLNSYEQVVGIYVAKSGGIYEEPIYDDGEIVGYRTVCGEDDAFFVKYFVDPTNGGLLSSNIPAIKIEPCVDVVVESDIIYSNKTSEASIRVIGKSKINNVQVRFKAGVEVILENGFESGNDFIASIEPCEANIIPLAKVEDNSDNLVNINPEKIEETNINSVIETTSMIAYPTVEIDDYIIIESSGLENIKYSIVSLDGKTILEGEYNSITVGNQFKLDLPNISNGMYLLNLYSNNQLKTIKLLK